jgi:hypothetical protein
VASCCLSPSSLLPVAPLCFSSVFLSLCFLSLSFSSSFCISLPLPICIRFLLFLSPFLRFLSPFLPLSLCILVPLCIRLSLRLFVSVSPSLSQSLPLCLRLHLVSLPSSIISSLSHHFSAHLSDFHLCIRSLIFTEYNFVLTGRYIIIFNLFPCLCRIVLEIALYMVYAGC